MIVGAHAVMANGGVIAPVGLHMVALAAHRHAVPFVVLAASHKVSLHFCLKFDNLITLSTSCVDQLFDDKSFTKLPLLDIMPLVYRKKEEENIVISMNKKNHSMILTT